MFSESGSAQFVGPIGHLAHEAGNVVQLAIAVIGPLHQFA